MRYAVVGVVAVVSILRPVMGAAQDAASVPSTGPLARLHPGQAVWVTTSDGAELQGRLVTPSTASLVIAARSGEQSIPMAAIHTIETPDSRKNGVRNGALIGGASFGAYVGLLAYALRCESDCGSDYSAARDTVEAVLWGAGVGAGGGALLGLWIDGLIKGRQVVYSALAPQSSAWEIRPVISTTRRQVLATLRW